MVIVYTYIIMDDVIIIWKYLFETTMNFQVYKTVSHKMDKFKTIDDIVIFFNNILIFAETEDNI